MYAELKQKVCKTCEKSKLLECFSSFTKNGKQYLRPFCKDCASFNWFVQDLWKHYRLRYDEYKKIYDAQEGKCACCGRPESDFKRRLHVDHDHSTGHVRALLCTLCNPLVGFAKEKSERLEMAIAYLNKFKKLG
jgi:hypothetical protein